MSIEVKLEHEPSILIARLSGVYGSLADEVSDRKVAQACKEGGYKKVLMDLRNVDVAATVLESYKAAESLENRGFDRKTKIAILDRLEFKEANQMYELVATNRGFQIQHFYTEEEARLWLGID